MPRNRQNYRRFNLGVPENQCLSVGLDERRVGGVARTKTYTKNMSLCRSV